MREKPKTVTPGLRLFWAYARRDLAASEPLRLAVLRRRLANGRRGAQDGRP